MTWLARWESRSGKWWVDLFRDRGSYYTYKGVDCMGSLGVLPSPEYAVGVMETKVASGHFQPDAARTNMRRVDAYVCSICRREHGLETVHACE